MKQKTSQRYKTGYARNECMLCFGLNMNWNNNNWNCQNRDGPPCVIQANSPLWTWLHIPATELENMVFHFPLTFLFK